MRSVFIRFLILLGCLVPALGDAGKVTTVWKWNATASTWAFYAPSMTTSDLATYAASKGSLPFTAALSASDGYWMNVGLVVPTPNATPLTPAYRFATATSHSCALTAAGAVKYGGLNGDGELAEGTNFPHLTPVDVVGF